MTIFEAVKTTIAPRIAAEHFGLSVSRSGMVCCPFHDDRHPSMKLYEDHYHCFGCQANGDVIAFTSKLFGITPLEAAQKLAADFGIREDRPSVLAKLKMYTTQAENEKLCFRVLSEYLHILQDWKKRYAPQTPEEEPDDRFVEEKGGGQSPFQRGAGLHAKTSVKRHDHIRRGAYGRKNAPYAPLFCPADGGQATQRQRNRWQQEKTDMVAG